ncbi:MAG: dienelactone hydrolase family protein [Zymomonas mobilis subsp. pomaceae]|uniref:Carboxymethylenebutenolidase n=1 Tax=Zymomonas mobilis subsp. pomaceae (strain ATCC 29192 / DSM 22645 / JCM 10191 / CCUG 17912 / NBRC 13757 / NCIMB 11200 / NRRL B-4491 / Barker I) TaxID=579138 RepID=F8ETW6_ZYMMT|nr:dienelactone hydrolase family protein [Zymomonas mobilis]AEI38063.1 Carboxymethylenebutenolidase [Zymomonas mobilis subsp. pomaceae ATCC 29192]MDX5949430.1 dienelactone hydrolase family protein [Zymomonas mobilis subsp. pomaceae]GEB89173.1 carboxymethylenebutenolidase [Zymomonas mobilis subsp. pomaceae]
MGEKITFKTIDKSHEISAYYARPVGKAKGVILIIPEIFGINEGIRIRVDRWAKAGYVALAPDLFWNIAPNVELDPDIPEEMQQAMAYYNQLTLKEGLETVEAALIEAKHLAPTLKVATVGYCLGGFLSFLMASENKVEAAIGYYGVSIDQHLDKLPSIKAALMLHFGGSDPFISKQAIEKIEKAFADQQNSLVYVYPEAGHGFATEKGKRRAELAAELADKRSFNFIEKALS